MVELDENGWPIDREALIGKEFVHFKGKRYQLLDFAFDSETQDLMVVYRTLYGAMDNWVRPAKMFFEKASLMTDEQHTMIAEDALFAEWISALPGIDFVRDGVVDEEAFRANPLKIVFVLKDTDGGGFDLREFLFEGAWNKKSGFRAGGHTYGPVRRVLAKIKRYFESGLGGDEL